jgi:hypothetical protein
MELHRTEQMSSPTGALVMVTIVGVHRHSEDVRHHVLQLKYGHERQHALQLARIIAPFIAEHSHADVTYCTACCRTNGITNQKVSATY